MNKKICVLVSGNIQSIHLLRWVNFFSDKNNIEIYILSPKRLKSFIPRVNLIDYPVLFRHLLWYLPIRIIQARIIERGIKPDLIHIHYLLYSLPFLFAKRPLIISLWGSDVLLPERMILKKFLFFFLYKWILHKAKVIITDAEEVKRLVIKKYKIKNGKLKVLPLGVDLNNFNLNKRDTMKYREKWDLPLDGFILLSLRTISPLYNIDKIVKTIPILSKLISKIHLVLKPTPWGQSKDKKYENYVFNLIKKLEIEDRVTVLPYDIPYENIAELYYASDIFISIPESDATSVSLLEAMACGAIPVVSNLPANQEWIKTGYNGVIIDEINPESIAGAIYRNIFSLSKEILDVWRKRNYNIILERASYHKNMKCMEQIYIDIVMDSISVR